jgi:hypothetical protein
MPAPPESSRGANRPPTGKPPASSSGSAASSAGAPAAPKANQQKVAAPYRPQSGTPLEAGCYAFVTVKPEKSTRDKGTAVHQTIREQLGRRLRAQYGEPVKVRLSDASSKPYKIGGCGRETLGEVIGGPRTGVGDIDLAFHRAGLKDMYIAEIKPAKWDCLAAGIEQLGNYVQKANASDEAKKTYSVTSFTPMPPVHEATRLPILTKGKMFEIQWCLPGIILYKEIKKDEDEEKKKEQRAEKRARAQNELTPQQRALEQSLHFQPWTPEQLRRDIVTGMLEDGLYLNRYRLAWPSGEVTNVVVWVKTGAGARDFQYYQQYPESADFFERFAARRGLSPRQADLIRRVMIEYNRDLLKFVVDRNGRLTGIGPWAARDLVRQMYIDRLRLVVSESARDLVTAGAAQEVGKAVQGAVGIGRSLSQGARSTPVREAPQLPVQEPAVPLRQEPVIPLGKPPKATLREPPLSIREAPAAPVRDAPAAPVRQAPVDPNVGGEILDGLGRSLELRQ